MHPTTTQHIKRGAKQSPVGTQGPCVRRCARVGTQRVALRITSANIYPDAPVETLRATSPTHHAPTRDTGDVARYVSTTGNGHANHYKHTAITTQHVASLHGIHQTAWDCGATPAKTWDRIPPNLHHGTLAQRYHGIDERMYRGTLQ